MKDANHSRVRFECCDSILRVEDMEASLRFYVNLLGFENASWGSDDFTHVRRDGAGIYLSQRGQGRVARGSGSVWKTSKGCMRNTKPAE